MWVLDKPSVRGVRQELQTALTYADETPVYALTDAEIGSILTAYGLYDQEHGRHHADLVTCGLSLPCRNALRNAYSEVQKHGRLKALRQRLLNAADECPLCGFGEPTQLDHYLPRADYKALAIYPRNLIPSCGPCNNAKRKHVGQGADEFVQAYFDDPPAINFLLADIAMNGAALAPVYRVAPEGLDPILAASLAYQFERLDLKRRYIRQTNNYLFGLRIALLKAYRSNDGEGFRAYLREMADDLDKAFGRNDWRAALMRGLAACDAFCDGGIEAYFAKRRRGRRAV